MRLGERLRSLREEKAMTQQELATVLGKSRAAIGKYETGARMPDNSTLHGICDYFDVTYDYMTGRSEFRQGTPLTVEMCFGENSKITYRGKMLEEREKKAILSLIETVVGLKADEEDSQ